MPEKIESSDRAVLNALRKRSSLSVSQLADLMEVTPTAVRQRLTRLMAQGLVERTVVRAGRGRPRHHYMLTEKGRRTTGGNFADLAMALWHEVRSIGDPEVRQRVLQGVSKRMATMYAGYVEGDTETERMVSVARLFGQRQVPLDAEVEPGPPVLTALACPYTGLAERDRSVCTMERSLFSELVGTDLQLSRCRLDGDGCCVFQAEPAETARLRPNAK